MAPTLDPDMPTTCACGVVMVKPFRGSTGVYCPNCDEVQPQEPGTLEKERGSKRIPTVLDRRYQLEWAKRERKIFGNGNGDAGKVAA